MSFDLEPCSPQFKWTDLSHTGPPSLRSRFQHTSIVVGESMFVLNGQARGRITNELWRYDAHPSKRLWTRLDSLSLRASAPVERYGRALVLTPWRVLSFGGFSDHDHEDNLPEYDTHEHAYKHTSARAHSSATPARPPNSWRARGAYTGDASSPTGVHDDVGHGYGVGPHTPRRGLAGAYERLGPFDVGAYDVVTGLWQRVATTGVPGAPAAHRHRGAPGRRPRRQQRPSQSEHQPVPRARYASATILVGAAGTRTRRRGVDGARVLLFGGDDGASFLDDLWSLDLGRVAMRDGEQAETE